MVYKRDFDQTYAPVVSWPIIRLLLILTLIHGWHTKQLDYVLAYPQAPVERKLFMEVPKGFEVEGGKRSEYALRLKRNLYGQPQSGRVWAQYLKKKLISVGWKQSKINECVYYKGKMIYIIYTDDSIMAGPDEKEMDDAIELMRTELNLTVEGDISDFLGVKITKDDASGKFSLTQPHLIDQVLKDLRLSDGQIKSKDIPMKSSQILQKHPDSPDFDRHFNYRSVIGKLNYLEKGSRGDIAYAVHQCARFASCPKKEHGEAVKWLGRYLLSTREKGLILKPDLAKSFDVYVDADFVGSWNKKLAEYSETARSRHGYVITYAGCPIVWKSQLQTEIALSTTESEYVGLSYALREAIPLMNLLKELKATGIPVLDHKPNVHCKVFEDNSGALEMARVHKYRPRTKHMATKYHHFRTYVDSNEISIHKIDSVDQTADILTKPLAADLFRKHRKLFLGW